MHMYKLECTIERGSHERGWRVGEQLSRSRVAPTYSLLYGCEPITTFWDDLIGQEVRRTDLLYAVGH